jgi:hypothetical protein
MLRGPSWKNKNRGPVMWAVKVITEARSLPIYLSEARRWVGMTDDNDTDQDPELVLLVQALTKYAESRTGRRFVDQELEVLSDCWPARVMELPIAPVVSIDYLQYLDIDGALQTLYDATVSPTVGAADVRLDTDSTPPRIQPSWGGVWPNLRGDDFNAVRIGVTAGYGTGGSPENLAVIPPELKVWLKRRLATMFEHREEIIVGNLVSAVPPDLKADRLLDPLMLGRRIA